MEFEERYSVKNGCIRLDVENGTCKRAGGVVVEPLTPTEFLILFILRPKFTKTDDILTEINTKREVVSSLKQGVDPEEMDLHAGVTREDLRVHINSIREKLGPQVIKNRRYFGYRLLSEEEFLLGQGR